MSFTLQPSDRWPYEMLDALLKSLEGACERAGRGIDSCQTTAGRP